MYKRDSSAETPFSPRRSFFDAGQPLLETGLRSGLDAPRAYDPDMRKYKDFAAPQCCRAEVQKTESSLQKLIVTRSQSYDFRIYNYNGSVIVPMYVDSFFEVEETIFVFKMYYLGYS
jgi:hypothetical protein